MYVMYVEHTSFFLYRVRRENLYTLTKHLFSRSVKIFSTHPVDVEEVPEKPEGMEIEVGESCFNKDVP